MLNLSILESFLEMLSKRENDNIKDYLTKIGINLLPDGPNIIDKWLIDKDYLYVQVMQNNYDELFVIPLNELVSLLNTDLKADMMFPNTSLDKSLLEQTIIAYRGVKLILINSCQTHIIYTDTVESWIISNNDLLFHLYNGEKLIFPIEEIRYFSPPPKKS